MDACVYGTEKRRYNEAVGRIVALHEENRLVRAHFRKGFAGSSTGSLAEIIG